MVAATCIVGAFGCRLCYHESRGPTAVGDRDYRMAIKRDKILKTAEKLVQKGKLEQAINEYEKLLNANPDDTNTINRLGDLYGRVGEIDKAVSLYEQVAEPVCRSGFPPQSHRHLQEDQPARTAAVGHLRAARRAVCRAGAHGRGQEPVPDARRSLCEKRRHRERGSRPGASRRDRSRAISRPRLKFADMLLESGNSERPWKRTARSARSSSNGTSSTKPSGLFRRLLDQELPNGDIMAPICDRLLDAGRVTSAQELLTAGLAVSPDSIPLRTLQVRAFMALGETDEAADLAQGDPRGRARQPGCTRVGGQSPDVGWRSMRGDRDDDPGRRSPAREGRLLEGAEDAARTCRDRADRRARFCGWPFERFAPRVIRKCSLD